MFSLCLSPTFEARVRFEVQAPTGASRQVVEFTGVFSRLTEPELRNLGVQVDAGELDDSGIADRLLVGWGADVTSPTGEPIPFTPETKARVLAIAGVPQAAVRAFRDALPSAAAGN